MVRTENLSPSGRGPASRRAGQRRIFTPTIVSIDRPLVERLDQYATAAGYDNRSMLIRAICTAYLNEAEGRHDA